MQRETRDGKRGRKAPGSSLPTRKTSAAKFAWKRPIEAGSEVPNGCARSARATIPVPGWAPDVAKKAFRRNRGPHHPRSLPRKASNKPYDQISESLAANTRSATTLTPPESSKDGGFRKIKVDATNKDYKVLARRGLLRA